MKLYLITPGRKVRGVYGWDVYDFAVVAAKSSTAAKNMHPGEREFSRNDSSWVKKPEHVNAQCLGSASRGVKEGVICASFNAG